MEDLNVKNQNTKQFLKNSGFDLSEDMRRKNEEQIAESPQQKQPKFEDFEKILENLKKLEAENTGLKAELESTKNQSKELDLKIIVLEKELDEFKKINRIQENCIENSESEILRLNECLKVTELMLQETVEISQEIISDLKSKLKSVNESVPKSPTQLIPEPINSLVETTTGLEVKGQPIKRQKSKASFYLELNRNASKSDKNKRELKVLRHQMSDDLRHLVIQMMKQLSQTEDTLEQLPDLMTRKLNKTFGKSWFCVVGENVFDSSAFNTSNNNYLKCELNEKYQVIIFKCASELSVNNSVENNTERLTHHGGDGDPIIRIVKKSHNFEAPVEKFIVNCALEALNRSFDDYHSLSSCLRDAICNKYNSQWFVSVGQTQHYCTSWALSRSRKFMLFEVGDIKFTMGEVAGWLW